MPQRWLYQPLFDKGYSLFKKIYQRKRTAHHNHEIHYLARKLNQWLGQGIQALQDGSYSPRPLKRWQFSDEVVDSLYLPDRILQHTLLQILKPTFQYIISPHCLHLHGPHGVKLASQRLNKALEEKKWKYVIRADIKSYYASIVHRQLVQDIKQYYQDPKVQGMLERIVCNIIETPKGFRNPDQGIPLRGPLSQLFSALYLKPLDDAFEAMDVFYVRYQDDLVILCQTKRQMNRCKRRMSKILQQRSLKLSRKKTRMGRVQDGFHFLGIQYTFTSSAPAPSRAEKAAQLIEKNPSDPGTQPQGHTTENKAHSSCRGKALPNRGESNLTLTDCNQPVKQRHAHPRTCRNAREQVRSMITSGFSTHRIRTYLLRWASWWVQAVEGDWQLVPLLLEFEARCFDDNLKTVARATRLDYLKKHPHLDQALRSRHA